MTLVHVALAVFAIAARPVAAQAPGDFAMRQPLAVTGDKAFFRVELPDAVYDGAGRPDLGDLRVFNGDGALVPFAFMPRPRAVAAQTPRRPLALFPLTVDTTLPEAADLSIKLRKDAAGTTVDIRARDGTSVAGTRVVGYLIDAGPADEHPLVALVTALPEGGSANARVRIDASDDLDRWRTVVAGAPLLALEYNGRRLVRDRIEFAPLRARYLRLTWLTPAPPELSAVAGDIGDRLVEPQRRIRKAGGSADADAPATFVFDLGAALPVDRITLELPEVNTVAPVSWEARTGARDPWHVLGSSVVYRLRQDTGEVVSAEFAIAPMPLRYFRARIDPRAGVGAAPPQLVAGWYAQEIVYAARGSTPFELAYGSRSVAPAALSIATLVPGYVVGKPLPDNVGAATISTAPSAANLAALREPLDAKRWLLWGSLVLASLLLAYMALRLSREMRSGPATGDAKPGTGPRNDERML
jgi:hypothetical protein